MKIMHIGDLHLGRSLREYSLIDDQEYILDQILDLIAANGIQVLLIAGDVFDKSIPTEGAVNLLDSFLSRLAEMEVETCIVSGNHDSNDRLAYGSGFFEKRGIHIAARYEGELKCVKVPDEHGTVNIWMLPFVRASRVRYYHPDANLESYNDAIRTILEHAEIDPDERNILIAHQFVKGTSIPKLSGSESSMVKNVGTLDMVSYEIFDDFDYVALGHIHSPQTVGRDTIQYSGSPLQYSLREADEDKYVSIAVFGEKGEVELENIQLEPRRKLRHITNKLDVILAPENISDTDDYIYVTLTDDELINNAMNIIRQVYPNTMFVDFDNSHTMELETAGLEVDPEQKTFEELISEFYLSMYGTEISAEELEIMKAVAGEAGVIDEAD